MDDKLTVQCWENLAIAVVLQALEDYRDTCLRLRKRPDLKSQEKRRRSLEGFFSSRWCARLTGMDVKKIASEIKKGEQEVWQPNWKVSKRTR